MLDATRRRAAATALIGAGLAGMLMLGGCGGGGGTSPSTTATPQSATLRLALTDMPACGYDAVNVTIQKVRVNQSGTASDSAAGWSDVVLDPPLRVDLLTLTNGVLAELGQTALPPGTYTQMRLVLAGNGGATPLANSVVPSSTGVEVPLETPSAQQSGLKMNVDITVAPDQLADFVLDFDACRSVVRAGNSGRTLLKPVVSVMPRLLSGVQGYVDASVGVATTSVSLQQSGVVVKATTPDVTGKFTLAPVPPGSYDLILSASGRAVEVVTDVVVASGSVTALNTPGTALAPPPSPSGTLEGTVSTGATPIDASVDATQSLALGRSIQVAGGPVDASTGEFGYSIPVDAPWVAPYVALPATLSFAPQPAAAGQYSLIATSGSVMKLAGPFTLIADAVLTQDFSFP
jgi:hypothetical protein